MTDTNQLQQDAAAIAEGAVNAVAAPIADAVQAVEATIANPSPANIINDLTIAVQMGEDLTKGIADLHPKVVDFFKHIFGL